MPVPDSHATTASLAGRTAIVTGGGSGIGQAIAMLFAERGARVAILDLAAEDTVQLITERGGTTSFMACDVSQQSLVDAAFASVAATYGPLDILVNSAGIAHVGNALTTSPEDFAMVQRVNVNGVAHCSQAAVACVQRVRNAQPGGSDSRLGVMPGICRSFSPRLLRLGTLPISPCV